MLFTADLRSFSDRLAASKKSKVEVDVDVKEENNDDLEVETKVTTALAVKRSLPDDNKDGMKRVKQEVEDDEKETKGDLNGVVKASRTTSTRRVSKRLQNR